MFVVVSQTRLHKSKGALARANPFLVATPVGPHSFFTSHSHVRRRDALSNPSMTDENVLNTEPGWASIVAVWQAKWWMKRVRSKRARASSLEHPPKTIRIRFASSLSLLLFPYSLFLLAPIMCPTALVPYILFGHARVRARVLLTDSSREL